jgi:amino acid transporter
MSDVSQGPGWWQAADLKWYPPELHADYVAPLPTPPGKPPVAPPRPADRPPREIGTPPPGGHRPRRRLTWPLIALGIILLGIILLVAAFLFRIAILLTIGLILLTIGLIVLIIGLVLMATGTMGRTELPPAGWYPDPSGSQQAAAAPGWYPDPNDPNLTRYFDGRDWTSAITPRG